MTSLSGLPLSSLPNGSSVNVVAGELSVIAGPDAGRGFRVAVGRSILGRERGCEFTIRDPHLEPHHVLVEADRAGAVWLTQLTGRSPMLIDQQPMNRAYVTDYGTQLEIGHTQLVWHPTFVLPAPPGPSPVDSEVSMHGPEQRRLLPPQVSVQMPTIGLIDPGDRAGGLDAAPVPPRSAKMVSLSPDSRVLTIVGSDVGPYLRAIVGQFAQAGWRIHSNHVEAECRLDDGIRGVRVADSTPHEGSRLDPQPHDDWHDDADLVITVTDDESTLDATGLTGAAIILGERFRGRYSANLRDLATVRLHLVGWHPTTFAATIKRAMRGKFSSR